MNLKATLLFAATLLIGSSSLFAQGGVPTVGDNSYWRMRKDQFAYITALTAVTSERDYRIELPNARAFELPKTLTVNKKREKPSKSFDATLWDYFEIEYAVSTLTAIKDGARTKKDTLSVYALPEVEITYAILYDSNANSNNPYFAKMSKLPQKPALADSFGRYTLFTRTYTYLGVTPGRKHYAAVAMHHMGFLYGNPILFSAQIKVNGIKQGEIAYSVDFGALKAKGNPEGVLTEAIAHKALFAKTSEIGKKTLDVLPWWESGAIIDLPGLKTNTDMIKDRSLTPFVLYAPENYNMVK